MSLRRSVVQRDRATRLGHPLRKELTRRAGAEHRDEHVRLRQGSIRTGIVRISRDRLLEEPSRLLQVLTRALAPEEPAFEVKLVGLLTSGRSLRHLLPLRTGQPRLQ